MTRRVVRLGRTELRCHPASLLMAAYMLLMGKGQLLAVGCASILVHECAHALCAAVLGWPPQSLEITPLGAMMQLEDEARMPPVRRACMLLAGPAATFGLCALAFACTRRGAVPVSLGRAVFLCDLSILTVNLLPALPLDGGRLLAALLGCFFPAETARTAMRALGHVIGIALIAGNVALSFRTGGLNLSLTFAGCFLLYAADEATVSAALREMTDRMARRTLLEKRRALAGQMLVVTDACPLADAVRHLPASSPALVAVVDTASQELLGLAGEQALLRAWLDAPEGTCREISVHFLDKTCAKR